MANKKLPAGFQTIQDRSQEQQGDQARELSNLDSITNMFSFAKDGKLELSGTDTITLPPMEKKKKKQYDRLSLYLTEEDANFLFGFEASTGMNHSAAFKWMISAVCSRMDTEEVELLREKGEKIRKSESRRKKLREGE